MPKQLKACIRGASQAAAYATLKATNAGGNAKDVALATQQTLQKTK